jgi:hypothetical protein
MTTMTAPQPTTFQQGLIDARLDTIDRMLMDRVPRSDRIAIVREVEAQIYELLAEHDPATVSREDVLDVLRRLDPPEAYLPEELEEGTARMSPRPLSISRISPPKPQGFAKHEGLISGLTGLLSFALLTVEGFMVMLASSISGDSALTLLLLGGPILLGIACTVLAFVFGIRARRQAVWPIVGMVFGVISFPIWMFGSLVVILQ